MFLTIQDVGVYAVALKIVSVFALVSNAFRMAWYPYFWETFQDSNHREVYRKVSLIVSLFMFTFVGLFALLGPMFLRWVTTPVYAQAAPLLGIMGLAAGLVPIIQTVAVGPDIRKQMGYNTLIGLGSACVNIMLLLLLVPRFGLLGVPISQLISVCLMLVAFWFVTERLYPIRYYRQPFVYAFLLALSIAVVPFYGTPSPLCTALLSVTLIGGLVLLGRRVLST